MPAGSASGGGSEGIKAGRAYVEIGARDAGLKAGLNAAKKAVLSLGKDIAAAGGVGLGLGGAIMAPILASLKEVVEHFSEINRAAIRTGASTEAISDLGYAAKQSGSSLEGVEAGIKFLNKNLTAAAAGSEEANDALAAFGLTVDDLKGKDTREQFLAISRGLDGIEESAKGSALKALFGRGGVSLRPMLENSAELARLLKENAAIGGQVSKEDAENAERIEKAYTRSTAAIKNAFLAIGAAILPHADTIDKFATGFSNAVAGIKRFVDDNRAAVVAVLGVGAAIAGVGAALVGLGLAVSVAGVAIGGLVTLASAAGTALAVMFSPAGLAVAAAVVASLVVIAALLETFPEFFAEAADAGEKAFGMLSDVIGTSWQGIKDALAGGDLKLAFQIAVDTLDVIWKGFVLALTLGWNQFKADFVDGWHDVITEVKVAIAGVLNFFQAEITKLVDMIPDYVSRNLPEDVRTALQGVKLLAGTTPEQIRADAAKEQKERDAARALSATAAAADLAAAELKRRQDIAAAKPPPVEAAPMPREVARQAALEGLGAVRGQMGGYGAGFGLATSGEAIQKKQLTQLEEINENTKELGGVKGW